MRLDEVGRIPLPPSAAAAASPPRASPPADDFDGLRPANGETVRREALLRWLAALDDEVSLLTVRAPAGYGKTTLLEQWAALGGRPFARLPLTRLHDDPARLAADLAGALQGAAREFGLALPLLPDRLGAAPQSAARVATALNSLDRAVLVLDDCHLVGSHLSLALITDLASRLRPGCLVVLAGRAAPGLRVSRLRGQGRCADLGPARLAFSRQEARTLLAGLGVSLAERALDGFVARTGGWPAGAFLAGLGLRADPGGTVEPVTFFVEEFVREEVLAGLPDGLLRFMLASVALDRLCAPLCDAALPVTSAARWLRVLREQSLVVPDQEGRDGDRDGDGEWYRYPTLLAAVLQREQRRRDPSAQRAIRRRAAQWYEAQGWAEQAICYALAGHRMDSAARLIEANGQRLVDQGRIHVVRDWLQALDGEQLGLRPALAAIAAWVWALTGDAPRALATLRLFESLRPTGPLSDGSSCLASARARVRAALAPDGVEEMLADARRSVQLEPPGTPWHTMAGALLGTAHLLTDSPGAAMRALTRAVRYGGDGQRPASSFAQAQLSLLAAERGQWTTAAAGARDARGLVAAGRLEDYPTTVLVHVACARIAVHRGDSREAWNEVRGALRLLRRSAPVAFPWLGAQASIAVGGLLLDLGELPGAARMVAEAEGHLASLLDEGPLLRRQYRALDAELRRRQQPAAGPAPGGLTEAELRVLRLLPTHLSLEEIARTLSISRNTVKSQVAAVYRKLHADRRADAVRAARDRGLLDRLP